MKFSTASAPATSGREGRFVAQEPRLGLRPAPPKAFGLAARLAGPFATLPQATPSGEAS